jgi:hypothetical protein
MKFIFDEAVCVEVTEEVVAEVGAEVGFEVGVVGARSWI